MGLDQWIHKITKPTDDEVALLSGKNIKELAALGYGFILFNEYESELHEALLDYSQVVDCVYTHWDKERIAEAVKAIEDSPIRCTSSSNTRCKVSLESGASYMFDTEYRIDEQVQAYVFGVEELAYFRKFYELQELVAAENTEWKLLTWWELDEMATLCRSYDGDTEWYDECHPGPSQGIFYHEWY